MSDRVLVGRVGRPHGRDGAFVVEDASDDPARFAVGAELLVEGQPTRVEESKRAGSRLVVRLDRPAPRGARLEFPRDALPSPDEGSYYVFDLLGLTVEEEGGRQLGRVKDVLPGIANDVLELESGLALPLVEACVRTVDVSAGRILIAPGFADPE